MLVVAMATGGGMPSETGLEDGGGGLAGHLHLFSLVKAAHTHTHTRFTHQPCRAELWPDSLEGTA